jgi:hypothetical protein
MIDAAHSTDLGPAAWSLEPRLAYGRDLRQWGLRWRLVLLACAASVVFFFRYQIGNEFTLLSSDRYDGFIELAIVQPWYNAIQGLSVWSTRSSRIHPRKTVTAQVIVTKGAVDRSRPSTSQRVDGTARRHDLPR